MATQRGRDKFGLKGKELIDKIVELTGSSNLLNYEGNIRDIGAKCEFLNLYNMGGRGSRGGLFRFFRAYHEALKDLNLYQNDIHRNYEALHEELYKKYEAVPLKKMSSITKKKIQSGEFTNKNNPPKEIKNNNQGNTTTPKPYERLSGLTLIEQVLALHSMGKTETSICIITGYKVHAIGVFRRAFAKSASVQLAPLPRMIKEMKDRELISKTPVNNPIYIESNEPEDFTEIEENNVTEEIIDIGELFIDREKITSQVKRAYRNPKFRKKVLEKYGSNCCCCDIAIETLIEAAHIVPVENNGNDEASNGLPLCPTHHTAFDNFLFTFNPTDNSIIYKEGLISEDLQITKKECKLNVSKESLEYRYKLFNQ